MANPKARAADYIDGFGLTEHEFELVRTLARQRALLPDQARHRQRRGAAQPDRRARPADHPVGPRAHRAPARRDPRRDAATIPPTGSRACWRSRDGRARPSPPTTRLRQRRARAIVDCQAQTIGARRLSGAGRRRDRPLSLLLTGFAHLVRRLFGYRLLLGQTPGVRDGVLALVKIGVVLALATSWPAYRTLVYDVALRGPAELAGDIGAPAGLPGRRRRAGRAARQSPTQRDRHAGRSLGAGASRRTDRSR